jgi:outer membrane protein assembly factor BamE
MPEELPARLWPRLTVRSTVSRLHRLLLSFGLVLASLCLTACVYRIDIQQGNLIEDKDVDQIEVGMTRSQVQFLLGTPAVSDTFHRDRWDYTYYYRRGRSREVEQRWMVVYFENERVARVERDVTLQPPS